jgi:hypothetical protein
MSRSPGSRGSFEVIAGYSVFSRLAEPASLAWVQRASRLQRPQGIMIVTTQLRDFLEFYRSLTGQEHEFAWHRALASSFVDTDAAFAASDTGDYLYHRPAAVRPSHRSSTVRQ